MFVWFYFFFLRIRQPPRSTRTDTLFPYTTLFRSDFAKLVDGDRGVGHGGASRMVWLSRQPLSSPQRKLGSLASGDASFRWHDGMSVDDRSEEHTSELQSLMRISYAVFCLQQKITNQ